jgi:hypothetical protein
MPAKQSPRALLDSMNVSAHTRYEMRVRSDGQVRMVVTQRDDVIRVTEEKPLTPWRHSHDELALDIAAWARVNLAREQMEMEL